MSQTHDAKYGLPREGNEDNLEQLLLQGVTLNQEILLRDNTTAAPSEEDDKDKDVHLGSDIQGALGLFAEAAQDMATANLELSLGRHFACADFCNQAVEKAAQSISLLRFGRRSTYDHNLSMLGALVGASQEIRDEMAVLTPFHPETFYAETPPEEADEVISAEQARSYIQSARRVMRWARNIVLSA